MVYLGSLDSSRNLQENYVISFLFRLDLILHAYKISFLCDNFGILNFGTKDERLPKSSVFWSPHPPPYPPAVPARAPRPIPPANHASCLPSSPSPPPLRRKHALALSIHLRSGWHPLPVPYSLLVPAAGSWRRRAPRVPVAGSCRHRAPLRARDTRAGCGLRPLAWRAPAAASGGLRAPPWHAPAAGSCRRRATRRDPANNRCWAPPPGAANETATQEPCGAASLSLSPVLILAVLMSQFAIRFSHIPCLFSLFLIPVILLTDANVFNLSLVRHNLAVIGPDLRSWLVSRWASVFLVHFFVLSITTLH